MTANLTTHIIQIFGDRYFLFLETVILYYFFPFHKSVNSVLIDELVYVYHPATSLKLEYKQI